MREFGDLLSELSCSRRCGFHLRKISWLLIVFGEEAHFPVPVGVSQRPFKCHSTFLNDKLDDLFVNVMFPQQRVELRKSVTIGSFHSSHCRFVALVRLRFDEQMF